MNQSLQQFSFIPFLSDIPKNNLISREFSSNQSVKCFQYDKLPGFHLIFPKSIFMPINKRLPGEIKSKFCGITRLKILSTPAEIRSHLYCWESVKRQVLYGLSGGVPPATIS